jgi:hypothetical protein
MPAAAAARVSIALPEPHDTCYLCGRDFPESRLIYVYAGIAHCYECKLDAIVALSS